MASRPEDLWMCEVCAGVQGRYDLWFEGKGKGVCEECHAVEEEKEALIKGGAKTFYKFVCVGHDGDQPFLEDAPHPCKSPTEKEALDWLQKLIESMTVHVEDVQGYELVMVTTLPIPNAVAKLEKHVPVKFTPELKTSWVLNECHVPVRDIEILRAAADDCMACPNLSVTKTEYSVEVTIDEDPQIAKEVADSLHDVGLSRNFSKLFLMAKEFGAARLALEEDGPVIEHLKKFY